VADVLRNPEAYAETARKKQPKSQGNIKKGKVAAGRNLKGWTEAVANAATSLGLRGLQGKASEFYKKALELYATTL